MHAKSSPTVAVRSAVLELVPELLYLHEVLVVILVLSWGVSTVTGSCNGISYFEILPWHLNIVEPGVLEVDQVVTEKVK